MFTLATAALASAMTFAAPQPVASGAGNTITDIVAASGGEFDRNRRDYDILLNAVLTADLAETLATLDGITVFAPNDFAFIRLARDLGYRGWGEEGAWNFLVAALTDLGGGDPIPVLTNVLLYHVAPAEVTAFDLIILTIFNQDIDTALAGATIDPFFIRLRDNDPDFRDPFVTWPLNIFADNGIIHNINRVLIPLDI